MDKIQYFIAVLPPEPVLQQALEWKLLLKEKFGCSVALKAPAHITLYPPFHFPPSGEAALLSEMDRFAAGVNGFDVQLSGFGVFDRQTIFINVAGSTALQALEHGLRHHLLAGLLPKQKKGHDFHPHMTIANRDIPEAAFGEAWSLFAHREYAYAFPVTVLALLRLSEGRWEIVHESPLGPPVKI